MTDPQYQQSDKDKSSWTGRLVAIIGAFAALLTALTGWMAYRANAGTAEPRPSATASDSVRSTSPTANWRGEANSFCLAVDDVMSKIDPPTSRSEYSADLRDMAKVFIVMDSQLRNLSAPEAEFQRVKNMADQWDQVASYYTQAAGAYDREDDATAMSLLSASDTPNAQGNAIANDLGISSCATVGVSLTWDLAIGFGN